MACFFVKCRTSRQVPRFHDDDGSKKSRKTQRDDIVGETLEAIGNKRRRQRRVDSKEQKTMSFTLRQRGERNELGGWLAAWLEEAESHTEKDEIKALEEAAMSELTG